MKKSRKIMLAVVAIIFVSLFVIVESIRGDKADKVDKADKADDRKNMKEISDNTTGEATKENLKPGEYYDSLDNTYYSWWIKRNENHEPSGKEEAVNLSDYCAYYCGNSNQNNEKTIYLTFDCGYDNGLTEKMLDILEEEKVPACFFVTQTYIRDNIEIVKRMKKSGFQVGNHTVSHPSLPKCNNIKIQDEIRTCANYMKEATGYDMDPYFRPPCGEYSKRVLEIAKDMGYKTVFWSIAYLDYDVNKQPGKRYVIDHFQKYHHDKAIVLMHNVSTSNAEALKNVIANLKDEGYTFKSLNDLR